MVHLDRAAQLAALEALAGVYPAVLPPDECRERLFGGDKAAMDRSIRYLEEHGLVVQEKHHFKTATIIAGVRITAAGLDFIAQDGGLTAQLGVVTVKLHEDTVRALLEASLREVATEKGVWEEVQAALKKLPAEAAREGVLWLLRLGAGQLPAALPWLEGLVRGR